MDTRRLSIVVILVVIAAVVGIQMLDPGTIQSEPQPIELDDSPSNVADDAVRNLTQRDFTYVRSSTSNRTPESRMDGFSRRVKVENSENEYYSNVTVGSGSQHLYSNDEAYWVRNSQGDAWKFGMRSDYTYPAGSLTNPFSLSKIRNASGEIVHENSSILVVRLDTAATARLPNKDFPGDYTLMYIDKRQKQIDRVTFKLNNSEWDPIYVHLRVTAVDETDVQRPPETRPSVKAVVMDVLRGPLFRVP